MSMLTRPMTIIHAGRSSYIVLQESQRGVGSLLSAAELSMRRNVASDSAAWLCSRVEDSPRPSAPAGEILRTRGAGNHRPRERLRPSKTSKFHSCSVVDRGRTEGSRPRHQGCQYGCAPVLKTDRDHPLRLVRYSTRGAGNHHPGERLRPSNHKNFNDPTQLRIRVFCPGIFAFLAVFLVVEEFRGCQSSMEVEP